MVIPYFFVSFIKYLINHGERLTKPINKLGCVQFNKKYFQIVKYFQLFSSVLENVMKNTFFTTFSHFLFSQTRI